MNPDPTVYGTNRSPVRTKLAAMLSQNGVDVATLMQSWYAEKRGLSSANSPQQLRIRQAVRTIPKLLEQLEGVKDPETGNLSGGLIHRLGNSPFPAWNKAAQFGAKSLGTKSASTLREFDIVAKKLATEQAFVMVGGNDPPVSLIEELYKNITAAESPEGFSGAVAGVRNTIAPYQESIGDVGPVTPTHPYQPGDVAQNPLRGQRPSLGTNPARGTVESGGGRVKVVFDSNGNLVIQGAK